MRQQWETLREFNTARFRVTLAWTWEDDTDISWDDTGEVRAKLESGEWGSYCFRVLVTMDGHELACDYLGNSIYADPMEFAREHVGLRPLMRAKYGPNATGGAYFPDMVAQAISEARKVLCKAPRVRC
jgi:hypothetical protein